MRRLFLPAFCAFLFFSCAKEVVKPPSPPTLLEEAPKPFPLEPIPVYQKNELLKNIDLKGFFDAVETVLPALEKSSRPHFFFHGGNFSARCFSDVLRKFKVLYEANGDKTTLLSFLTENFDLIKLEGENEEERALFTAYFVPSFEARKTADENFKYPLYSLPKDLMMINLTPLGPSFRGAVFRGRIDDKDRLVPYYTRKEIDGNNVLKNEGYEIAYLKDPLDVLILQIQGSGIVVFEDGEEMLAGYAGKNGHPYKSVGRHLADNGLLPIEEVSWQSIKQFLRDHPETSKEILFSNPSYVFFSLKKPDNVVGSLGLPLTPFHSIAVDKKYIPPLSLCLIDLQKPLVGEDGLVKGFTPLKELAFAMDEGSAIKGPLRVDIFLGPGHEAEKLAGALKSEGELYILVPKNGRN